MWRAGYTLVMKHPFPWPPCLAGFLLATSCAGISHQVPREGIDYGIDAGTNQIWVRGPWEDIRPSKDVDEVIDQLCHAVMKLPLAQRGEYGQEYCGIIYKLVDDSTYYASTPSPMEKRGPSRRGKDKSCLTPKRVKDSRGTPRMEADFHGHPWSPSDMSQEDKMARRQWFMFRIQFDTRCRTQKLIPFIDTQRPGELYERQENTWRLIGHILPENKESGFVTPVTHQTHRL